MTRPSGQRVIDSDAFAVAIAVTGALLITSVIVPDVLYPPDRVGLHLSNPTAYSITIHVSDEDGRDWVPLGTLQTRSDRAFEDVIDQGDEWTFQFHGQGRDAGEFTIARSDLEAADWHFEVPAEVARQLQEQGAPPSP